MARITPVILSCVGLALTAYLLAYAYNNIDSSVSYVATTTPEVNGSELPSAPNATSSTSTPSPMPTPTPKPTPVPTPTPGPNEIPMEAYITGYSYWDNTPPGSSIISHGVVHREAGGTGTFADPITLAVGHSWEGGVHTIDYPAGTRFYLPYLKKYVMVEDTCGDGDRPQDGPCHTGYQGRPWLDVYVDGAGISKSASDACMRTITGIKQVIRNPGPNYPVVAGSLSESGCSVF